MVAVGDATESESTIVSQHSCRRSVSYCGWLMLRRCGC